MNLIVFIYLLPYSRPRYFLFFEFELLCLPNPQEFLSAYDVMDPATKKRPPFLHRHKEILRHLYQEFVDMDVPTAALESDPIEKDPISSYCPNTQRSSSDVVGANIPTYRVVHGDQHRGKMISRS